jgi:hypothetical protein
MGETLEGEDAFVVRVGVVAPVHTDVWSREFPADYGAQPSAGERTMVGTRTRFIGEKAPCGKTVDGEHYLDEDEEGLVIRDEYFSCGCRRSRHEYHDGSIEVTAVRHDGKVARDELGADHGS